MKAIEFPGVNIRIAEHQDEYETLPAEIGILPVPLPDGSVAGCVAATCCFKLDEVELAQVQKDGVIFLTVLTFGEPLQPIHSTFLKPELQPIPQE